MLEFCQISSGSGESCSLSPLTCVIEVFWYYSMIKTIISINWLQPSPKPVATKAFYACNVIKTSTRNQSFPLTPYQCCFRYTWCHGKRKKRGLIKTGKGERDFLISEWKKYVLFCRNSFGEDCGCLLDPPDWQGELIWDKDKLNNLISTGQSRI